MVSKWKKTPSNAAALLLYHPRLMLTHGTGARSIICLHKGRWSCVISWLMNIKLCLFLGPTLNMLSRMFLFTSRCTHGFESMHCLGERMCLLFFHHARTIWTPLSTGCSAQLQGVKKRFWPKIHSQVVPPVRDLTVLLYKNRFCCSSQHKGSKLQDSLESVIT